MHVKVTAFSDEGKQESQVHVDSILANNRSPSTLVKVTLVNKENQASFIISASKLIEMINKCSLRS